jgi:hypothetical protein
MRENLELNGHRALVTNGTQGIGRDSNLAFWFAVFSPLIGVIGGLIFAWFFSSLGQ